MKLKRILALMLASSILIASLTACSSEETAEEGTTGEDTTQTTEGTVEALDYSSFFNENGYFEGVTATDYVTLPDFATATLPEETLFATQEELDTEIEALISAYTTQEAVTDTSYTAQEGDTVNITFVGSIDGVEFEGGTGTSDLTLGAGQFIPGFEEAVIGHNVGETFDIDVTFPEDYGNEELDGKDAVFNITIHNAYQTVTPEFTDEFVSTNFAGVYSTTDEVAAAMEESIIYTKQTSYISEFLNTSEFAEELPTEVLTFVEETAVYTQESTAAQYGMDLTSYLSLLGYATIEAFVEDNQENFEISSQVNLTFQAVMETIGYELDEDTVKSYTDLIFGEGTYDMASEELGYNYIAYIASQNIAMEEVHKTMIANTDGAVVPSYYTQD